MAWQVAGNHRETLVQRPVNDMSIEPGVIIKTVKDKQGRFRPFRPPDLADHLIAIDLKTPQPAAHVTRGKIQSVKTLIRLRLR
ncbi:hypothetical protein D3C87_1824070 [compost metagenome]